MILVFFETGCKTLVLPQAPNDEEEEKKEYEDPNLNQEDNDPDIENEIEDHETFELDDRTIKFLASFFSIILEVDFKRLRIIAKRF